MSILTICSCQNKKIEGEKVINGMHRAIVAYVKEGNNVIVDYIKYEQDWLTDLQDVLKDIKVVWVGVNASLESVEKRENRPDKLICK